MRVTSRLMISAALLAAAPSCASRERPTIGFPSAADLTPRAEPAYPVAALEPGPEGAAAEAAWNDAVLIWGRDGWAAVARLCSWAQARGMEIAC